MNDMSAATERMPAPTHTLFGHLERAIAGSGSRIKCLNNGELGNQLFSELLQRLQREQSKVLSLDVFDTLLLRNDVCEARRYLELSTRISNSLKKAKLGHIAPIDIYIARCEALEFGYRTSQNVDGCVEGRIEQVVANQVRNLSLPESAEHIFLNEELRYEAAGLTPNKPLISVAQEFVRGGGKVILISDMYLSATAISAILLKVVGKLPFIDRIDSSADAIRNKRSGTIFPWIEKEMNIAGASFLHVGDSLISDFQRPIAAGWKAMHFPISYTEHSRRLESLKTFTNDMTAAGLDMSRWAKL